MDCRTNRVPLLRPVRSISVAAAYEMHWTHLTSSYFAVSLTQNVKSKLDKNQFRNAIVEPLRNSKMRVILGHR